MKRHCPEEDLIGTAENARVAVSSRGLASAAAEGLRTTPARDTDMTEEDAVALACRTASGAGVMAGLAARRATVEPNVKDWVGSAVLQSAIPTTAP